MGSVIDCLVESDKLLLATGVKGIGDIILAHVVLADLAESTVDWSSGDTDIDKTLGFGKVQSRGAAASIASDNLELGIDSAVSRDLNNVFAVDSEHDAPIRGLNADSIGVNLINQALVDRNCPE